MSNEFKTNLAVLEKQTISLNTFINKNDVYTYYENLLLNNTIDSSIIIEDIVGNELFIKDLHINMPTLILFIHQAHCSSCWGKAMEILLQNYPEIAEEDLIVLTSYQNFRDIAIQLQELQLTSKVYNIVSGSFGNVLKELDVPFIITTGQNLQIESVSIIDKDIISQFDSYIKAFRKRKYEYPLR